MMDARTERMLVVNFWMCVVVMLACLATAVANWRMAAERAELFAWMDQLQQRVIALEEKELERQQYKRQPLQQHLPRNQE